MEARQPFNPADPFDSCADRLREGVADLAIEVLSSSQFCELPPPRQLSCALAGLMTGVMGSLLAFLPRDQHDDFIQVIGEYLPDAQRNVYEIAANAPEGGLQ